VVVLSHLGQKWYAYGINTMKIPVFRVSIRGKYRFVYSHFNLTYTEQGFNQKTKTMCTTNIKKNRVFSESCHVLQLLVNKKSINEKKRGQQVV